MTLYAYYDSTVSAPSPVIGWIDNSQGQWEGKLPPEQDLLILTEAQWEARAGFWAVSNGTLTEAQPVFIQTLAQQVSQLLANGLTITSASTSAVDGSYPCTLSDQSHIQAEVISILLNNTFADGTTSVAMPEVNGTLHTFPSVALFKSFAAAIATFVAACAKVTNGTTTTLPSNQASIP